MKVVVDSKRGCGWRKPGGLYLVSGGLMRSCGRLPIPLDACPCCGAGIKQCRGWTWINPAMIVENHKCKASKCDGCPLEHPPTRAGLLWVGEAFYPTPADFTTEAAKLGISRRVKAIPRGFVVGETWVFFAHPKTIRNVEECQTCDQAQVMEKDGKKVVCPECKGRGKVDIYTPGLFHAFKPTEVQYVVKGTETPEELADLEKRGITPVIVKHDEDLDSIVKSEKQ